MKTKLITPKEQLKKILFIDDHAVVRSGFAKILSTPFKPVEIDEAENGAEAIEKIKQKKFDLVVMDVQMPGTDTFDLVKFIINHSAGTKILMLSIGPENIHAKHYLQAGANGYISKQASVKVVVNAMKVVLSNKIYISDTLAESIVKGSFRKKGTDNPFDNLSRREYEITTLLLHGNSVTDISTLLKISTSTIGTYKARIFEKFKVSNLIELKEIAMTHYR